MTDIKETQIRRNLNNTLERTSFAWGEKHEGKVRDNYVLPRRRRVMIATDRLSAFDRHVGSIPLRGQVLTQSSLWWFDQTRDIVDNHCLGLLDPTAMLVQECEPIPVEMVMRSYVTGCTSTSIWTHYQKGVREFCGNRLPDGLRQHERLREPMLTPSTKAPKGQHDESVSRGDILAQTGISPADFDACADLARALFDRGSRICEARGVILVDTKYEFGKAANGRIIVMDEIHTPDCSRFWDGANYEWSLRHGADPENYDKEYARTALQRARAQGTMSDDLRVELARRYIDITECIIGGPLDLDDEEPLSRLARNIDAWLRSDTTGGDGTGDASAPSIAQRVPTARVTESA